jgi:hypothetical protein
MTTVATFNDQDKAEVLLKQLQDAGIHAEIFDETKLQKYWFLSHPLAGMKVRVEEHDFDRAMQLLGAEEATENLKSEVRCPQCGSAEIEYPQFTRKFIVPTLMEIFCVLKLVDREFYCEKCHFTWPTEHKIEPHRDPLGWPVHDSKGKQVAK